MNSLMMQQEIEKVDLQTSSSTTVTGFNMKQYEEELIKLRNDNFSLKLRIHLLEERQGLELRPGDDASKENVFRVNLDLRVEKETLKQQIEEKDKLLRDAYVAIEEMEREKSRQDQEILDLQRRSPKADLDRSQRELLMEAFGSMNLGVQTKDLPELNEEGDASLRNFEEIEKMQKEIEEERQKCEALTEKTQEKDDQIAALLREKDAMKKAAEDNESQVIEMNVELERKHMECVDLRQEFDAKEAEIVLLLERIEALESEGRHHSQLSSLSRQESDNLQQQMAILKANFAKEKGERDDEWREKCHGLSSKLDSERKKHDNLQETLNKTQLSVAGLTEMNAELQGQISELKVGVETRDKALEILKEEYEKLKTRYRKFKGSAQKRTSGSSIHSRQSQENKENVDTSNNVSSFPEFSLKDEELRISRKENELLRSELKLCKSTFMRSGATKAVELMEGVYKGQMKKVEGHHDKIVGVMRKRLEELSEWFQKLLSVRNSSFGGDDSLLDVSLMSESLLNASKSFLLNGNDLNDTQLPEDIFIFPSEEIIREFGDGEGEDLSPVTVKTMVGHRLKEYENLMTELRDSSKRTADAEGQVLRLKREVNQIQADRDELKLELSKTERKVTELNGQLVHNDEKLVEYKTQLADTQAILDGLRVKNGCLKESVQKLQEENGELRNASKLIKLHEVEEKLRQTEAQHKTLLEKYSKAREYSELLQKEVESYKETEVLLKEQIEAHENDEDLKTQLAASNEKLAKYRDRQRKMEKEVKQQLAKTHEVLKKTKANFCGDN